MGGWRVRDKYVSRGMRATRRQALPNLDRSDAQWRERDRQRRSTYGHLSSGHRLHGVLPLSRSRGHLIQVGGAGERLAVDRRDLGGSGTIDGHEDDPARCGAIRTRVHDHVLDIAGGSLQRGVPEVRVYPVKAAERPEAGENVSIRTAWRPEVGCENPLAAEDAEVICLGDGARDVVPAAVLVFGDGDLHAREFGDRKSTRLNSSHSEISYAVFCLKKKKKK